MKLPLTYALLAMIATAANIGAQDLCIRAYTGPGAIAVSMLVGTGVGLVVKYLLDKRYIFAFRAANVVHEGRTFLLYSVTGVLTTLVFWGVELGFHAVFGTDAMRYVGGVIGLAIGYVAKYHLDRRYVFGQGAA